MKPILAFLSFMLLTAFASAEFKQPNVVTLLVDDLGYRDLGCYGGPVKTPVIDKLAAGGVRFTDFHSGAPSCSPSRATFLTGRQHCRTGVYSVIDERFHRMHLLESETTIAEVLKKNGYATAHFGKWHLGMPVQNRDNPTPADHGFDYWFGLVNGPGPSHKNPTNFLRNGERVGTIEGYSCQIVVDEALTWLDQKRDGDEPFFLNLWFNEPHDPIAAPDEIVSQYGALKEREAIYSGTIDNTDRAIGRLVAKLETLGELDNTIIIYSSDNGSYLQERNGELRGKKGALFEGGHRVPGIFYWKGGIPGGRVEDEPAGAVDLLPTLCGLIGIDKPVGVHLDGSDLAPLLTRSGNLERHQPLFWMAESNMVMRVGDHTLLASSTAKSPINFKTADRLMEQIKEVLGDDLEKELNGMDLRSRLFNGSFANPEADRLRNQFRNLYYFNEAWIPELKKSEISGVQLYDISSDLGQQTNIASERPELVARLKEQAAAIYRSVMADAPKWGQQPEETTLSNPSSPGLSPEDRELTELLTRIDQTELPDGYDVTNHQPWVDRRMEALKPEQRSRIGRLWKEKRRLQPNMKNAGMSFVRILEYVAAGEKLEMASIEKETHIHRLATTKRSVFDAFVYLNRIPIEPETLEDQEGLASRIESRLANQEGRIQIKLPPTMIREAYEGFKLAVGIGSQSTSCIACHHLPDLGNVQSDPSVPTLRNRTDTREQFGRLMRSDTHKEMTFDDANTARLFAFVQSLKDVPDSEFRLLILNATVLDTTGDIE